MLIEDAVGAVLARVPEPTDARPILIGIDGLGGAGKTSLADAIADARPDVQVVHGDDFYGPEERDWRTWTARQGYERYFDHRRLMSELLEQLRLGRPGRFQRYDWGQNALGEWTDVAPHGLVVMEGVYLLRPQLRWAWDLTVFVEVPRDLRAARLQARGHERSRLDRALDGRRGLLRAGARSRRRRRPRRTGRVIIPGGGCCGRSPSGGR